MSKKWSASRVSTYHSCPLKYYYTYIQKWQPNKKVGDDTLAKKGTCFHETVEHYKTGMSKDDLVKILESKIKEYNVDETQFDERGALNRFFLFWEEMISKREKEGFKVAQESWANNNISGEEFCGALDVCLTKDDNSKVVIFDYKSAKTPNASQYKNQLVLYAYLKGLELGWNYQQIADNIQLYVFFPFSEQTRPVTDFDKMLASVKQLNFTAEEVESIITDYYMKAINESKAIDWKNADPLTIGKPGFMCKWCDWNGAIGNDTGFKGCPASYKVGCRQERGIIYHLVD